VITKSGVKLDDVSLTKKQKHAIVKKIYSAKSISNDDKKSVMEALEKFDQSDLLGKTKFFCESALPEIEKKREAWSNIFGGKLDKESLMITGEFCAGFKQFS
jgi:hypothetical protein